MSCITAAYNLRIILFTPFYLTSSLKGIVRRFTRRYKQIQLKCLIYVLLYRKYPMFSQDKLKIQYFVHWFCSEKDKIIFFMWQLKPSVGIIKVQPSYIKTVYWSKVTDFHFQVFNSFPSEFYESQSTLEKLLQEKSHTKIIITFSSENMKISW